MSSGGVTTANFLGLDSSEVDGCLLAKGWQTLGLDVCLCDMSNRPRSASIRLGLCFFKCITILSWMKVKRDVTSSDPFVKNWGEAGVYLFLTSQSRICAFPNNFFGTRVEPLIRPTTCKISFKLRAAVFIAISKSFRWQPWLWVCWMPSSSNSKCLKFGFLWEKSSSSSKMRFRLSSGEIESWPYAVSMLSFAIWNFASVYWGIALVYLKLVN